MDLNNFQVTVVCKQIDKSSWEAGANVNGCAATGNGHDRSNAVGNAATLLVKKLESAAKAVQPAPAQVNPQVDGKPQKRSLIGVRCLATSGLTRDKYCRPHGKVKDNPDGTTTYLVSYEDGTPDGRENDKYLIPQE
jgi:hypothetical protein